jgi:hypothetical protein
MVAELSPLTCTAEELHTVVSGRNPTWLRLCLSNPRITENHLLSLLRNPRIVPEIIQTISRKEEWISSYKLQVAIVNCPKTPFPLALRMVQMLFWRDLLKIAGNFRLSPKVRRSAENQLRDKVQDLTLGEKVALARTAPRPVISFLRWQDEPEVIRALLRNSHLVEDDIMVMINEETTPKYILEAIGSDFKWSLQYPIRVALVRNKKTPLNISLKFLSRLQKQDLKALAEAPYTPELLRRTAIRILSGEY